VSLSSPTLYPLVSCEGALTDGNLVAMGCLARDFLPSSITFSWSFKNNSEISSRTVRTFPVVKRGDKYMATSQVLVPSKDVLQGTEEYLVCKVQHDNSNRDLRVSFPVDSELPPNVSVFIPPRDSFSGSGTRKSRLICQATGFSPKQISVSWLRDGQKVESGVLTKPVEAETKGAGPATFSISSMLTITESDWLSQSLYTCRVDHRGIFFDKNVSMSSECSTSECPVPRPGQASSRVSTGGSGVGKQLARTPSPSPGVGSAACCPRPPPLPAGLPRPGLTTFSLPTEVAKHPPAVYVLPPAREQLVLRESATVTCLVKGFSPADVFVQWQQRGQPLSSDKYVTSAPAPEPQAPGLYFTHSTLTVTEEDWNSGETFTCVVGHEALPHMVTERTVDKSTEGEVGAEEEGFENLWTTASTFIVLFLLSLFYSTTVTLFKVAGLRQGWGAGQSHSGGCPFQGCPHVHSQHMNSISRHLCCLQVK
uniref:Immunoglobulin heavy constant mu n=1 Tax=Oryctolagus cuniculus TaxID=9986 RepID=A0A5F9CVX8_RABIT